MACMTRLPDGTPKQKDTNIRCTGPRRTRYEDPNFLRLDLRGHWRLFDARGRSCEVVISHEVSLSPGCIALGSPITQLKTVKTLGSTLELGRSNGQPLLSFETSNLDALTGIQPSGGYRLVRTEAQPLDFRQWEGLWTLKRGAAVCDIFLSMRTRRLDEDVEVKIPHDVNFSSGCLSPTDDSSIEIIEHRVEPMPQQTHRRDVFARTYRTSIPRWTTWTVSGHDITFRDAGGQAVTFEVSSERDWVVQVPRPGESALIMHLQPARR
jgi:hypothetical protein